MFERPHGLATAEGTQPWRLGETVFELDPRMEHVWVSVQNMGTNGEFAVRDFQIAFVRDRPALAWQLPLLLLAWCAWLVGLMRLEFLSKVPSWRCALGAACVLVLVWFLGLPGIGTAVYPLATGHFAGLYQPAPRIPAPAASSPVTALPPVNPSAAATSAAPPVTEVAERATSPVPRRKPMLEWVSRKWDMLHAAVFFALTIALLALTESNAIWQLSAGVMGLIQGVEWLHLGSLDFSDGLEMFWASAGIAAAVWVWRRKQLRENRR